MKAKIDKMGAPQKTSVKRPNAVFSIRKRFSAAIRIRDADTCFPPANLALSAQIRYSREAFAKDIKSRSASL